MELFRCYCFDSDGKYDVPKDFDNPQDALTYVSRKINLFPRVLVTDALDCTIYEAVNGETVFPIQEQEPSENRIKVLIVEPHKEPYTSEIENALKAMQAIVGGCITLFLLIAVVLLNSQSINQTNVSEIQKNETSEVNNIEITAGDLQEYRNNIGNDMDVKKSILIVFNSQEECQKFIDEYGNEENPLSLGKGIIPQTQGENGEQYYNVAGNAVFEQLFDNMKDGEYLKKPTEFGGAYCYFKRLTTYSILDNDEKLTELIKQEKSMKKGGESK